LVHPIGMSSDEQIDELEAAARRLAWRVQVYNVTAESELDAGIAAMVEQRVGALYVTADPFFTGCAARIVALAARYAIPASYAFRSFTLAGGLMSYGANLPDQHRQAGVYAGRILKGARPADLPVLLPTRFDLVINLKA